MYAVDSVAYVVGDYGPGANQDDELYYTRAWAAIGTGTSTARVEWDQGPSSIAVDAAPVAGTTDASDVLRVWNVSLVGGQRYEVRFNHGGAAKLRLALFDNPGGTYWVPRSGAAVERGSSFWFDAPRTDVYGLVLANDNGQSGTYEVSVNHCTPPIASTQNVSLVGSPNSNPTDARWEVNLPDPTWAAVGLLPTSTSQNWDLKWFADRNGPAPLCFSNERASSAQPATTMDVIAGRPNLAGSGGQFFAQGLPAPGITQTALFQWDQGTQSLTVGAPLVAQSLGAGDNLRCWQVNLDSGTTYSFVFERPVQMAAKLLLFRPTSLLFDGGWRTRAQAEFDVSATTSYKATVSGTFGVVLANDAGAQGSCNLGVRVLTVGVEPGDDPSLVTSVERVVPNPVAGSARIHYALARHADVSFDVLDAAGRRVTRIAEGARDAGRWSADWSGSGDDGARLAAGVYFVRMRVDGVAFAHTRLVILR
jgi:hypothetical protein